MARPGLTVEALLARAIGHVNDHEPAQALAVCEEAQRLHPAHPAVLQLLAVLGLQAGRIDTARRCIGANLALRPDHGPSLLVSGDAARAAGDRARSGRRRGRPGDRAAPRSRSRRSRRQPRHRVAGRYRPHRRRGTGLRRALRCDATAFGRIAHALAAGATGRVWLDLDALRGVLLTAAD
jgi:hypothetical protein